MAQITSLRRAATTFCAALLLTAASPSTAKANNPEWLRKAVFYQIYPSSFMDSDGNGIGDLPGITAQLDYIQSLGVNALWLNPIFESGWFDGGYDVIDFYKVDPRFGTNTDLVTLVSEAHRRGIRVCLDLVAGHSSTQCQWFQEALNGDPNGRYSDYYIWPNDISAEEKQLITDRNNCGNAEADTRGNFVEANAPRGKYYQKNFFPCQPALNYGFAQPDPACPWQQPVTAPGPQALRREMRNIMAFWMDKGVDGFRVDMAMSLVKNDPGGVETARLWHEMRAWVDEHYPDNVLISEWANPPVSIPAGFNIDFMIHFGVEGYGNLFFAKGTPNHWNRPYDYCYFDREGKGELKTFIDNYTNSYSKTRGLGYIALPSANHDFQRPNIGTRNTADQLKVAMTFFLTMPGVPFIYYGDEIGMKYIEGLPNKEGSNERAGTRTPMQWAEGPTAGFSTCAPSELYLPVDTEGGCLTVERQQADPQSLLNYTRQLIALRQQHDALGNDGEWTLVSSVDQPYPMVYSRTAPTGERFLVALNPSGRKATCQLPAQGTARPQTVVQSGKAIYKAGRQSDRLTLQPCTAVIYKMQ